MRDVQEDLAPLHVLRLLESFGYVTGFRLEKPYFKLKLLSQPDSIL